MTITTRVLAGLLTLMLTALALAGAGPASAHAALISSNPAADSSLPTAPAEVSATFSEDLQPAFAAMTVVGPDGNLWSAGDVRVDGPVATVGLRPLGPAGTYTANYRVTSADGHVINGSWSFDLTVAQTPAQVPGAPAAPEPEPAAAPATSTDDGLPIWPFAVGAVLLVGAGVWWSRRRT
ncbi:copper resistance CopC family protein [Mycobacterium sp. AMU20-3851]|uniref:copper resistance CopC family protein n=1 Tax=Mycobacterium sp. AMU20-3851 TaxID=3122055 RepID=UPI0037550951